ncbi:MAG: hypothetical protein QXF12_00265 [Candidatus Aenigmatarchaeota archaeon]
MKYTDDLPFTNIVSITDREDIYDYYKKTGIFSIILNPDSIEKKDLDIFLTLIDNINNNCDNVFYSVSRDNDSNMFFKNIVCKVIFNNSPIKTAKILR